MPGRGSKRKLFVECLGAYQFTFKEEAELQERPFSSG